MVGAVAMIAITGLTLIWMTSKPRGEPVAPDHRVAATPETTSV
jgi:hypothetical protein